MPGPRAEHRRGSTADGGGGRSCERRHRVVAARVMACDSGERRCPTFPLASGERRGAGRSRRAMGWGGGTGYGSEVRFRSEEHTSELQSIMRISYAVFCLKKINNHTIIQA